jgi:hypothetical protein
MEIFFSYLMLLFTSIFLLTMGFLALFKTQNVIDYYDARSNRSGFKWIFSLSEKERVINMKVCGCFMMIVGAALPILVIISRFA